MNFIRLFFVAMLLALTGCQTTQPSLNEQIGAVKIESIDVTLATRLPEDSLAAQRLYAFTNFRLSKQSVPTGKPIKVYIQITRVHRKDPALSLIVGDSNSMTATLTLSDTSGKPILRRELFSMNGAAINGVVGAVVAAASNPAEVDDALADDLASKIERSIFGKALEGRMELPNLPADAPTSTVPNGILVVN